MGARNCSSITSVASPRLSSSGALFERVPEDPAIAGCCQRNGLRERPQFQCSRSPHPGSSAARSSLGRGRHLRLLRRHRISTKYDPCFIPKDAFLGRAVERVPEDPAVSGCCQRYGLRALPPSCRSRSLHPGSSATRLRLDRGRHRRGLKREAREPRMPRQPIFYR